MAGNDKLYGGAGDDKLIGGGGNRHPDTMSGGGGADTFVYLEPDGELGVQQFWDYIADYNFGEGDKVDVSGIDTNLSLPGDQAFTIVTRFSGTGPGEIYSNIFGTFPYPGAPSVVYHGYVHADIDGDGRSDLTIQVGAASYHQETLYFSNHSTSGSKKIEPRF
ncbi:hypothetical protein FVA77_17335 [Phyllobacterium endophyticum]|nr:hypothetical protein FVA77_17335 [Phyllobacterium endophyticum]